jgi:hypothetical protein
MIIRESIIELALEKLQDEKQYRECDLVVREECAPEFAVDRLCTSKTGGRYLALALVRPADGSSKLSHLMLELVPATQ